MRAHCDNAEAVARSLDDHREVESVLYPGLPGHRQHDLARRQMDRFGGMITIETGSGERARRLASSTRLFQLAESLGGVESLVCVPAEMTHASMPEARREEIGLTPGLVRLSVGIEDTEDLVADLEEALDAL
jgi:cystathionine beta-lyase/cystathionine gamma-synthase